MMLAGHADQLLLLVGAAWFAVAVGATLAGVRRAAVASRAAEEVRVLGSLLAASPMAPVLVYPDATIDADPRIADWLGLHPAPHRFADLAPGLATGDLDRLERTILATLDSGAPFEERLAIAGSDRTLLAQGAPYVEAGVPDRAVLLWLVDISVLERETTRLTQDTRRLGGALEGLSLLIEAAPFPIWHRSPDGGLALVNRAYVEAVEAADVAEVVRRGLELVEPGTDGTAADHARAARDRAEITSRTAPAILGGQRRMTRVFDVPIGSAGVAGFATDVQELEEARADLARLARAQRDMLDRLSAGVAQFGGDHGLSFFNRDFLRMFALEPQWLADRPELGDVLDRMRESQRVPEARDFRAWREERRGWFQSAEPTEETWLLPTGTHLRVVAQPMPDGGLLLIFEDRTEHLQLASARDTLLRVRTATFDNLFEAVGVFAQDGRLQLWNSRFGEVWALTEGALSVHPRIDALVQQIAPRLADPAQARAIRDLVRTATLDRQQRDGRIALRDGRHFQFAAVPLPDGNALFTLIDITASRGIEEALRDRNAALEQVNRIRNDFVERMSHELRDPLTAISGYAEMLAGGYAGALTPVAGDYAAAIATAVARLGGLIGDVLDLSQTEAGTLPLATDRIDVVALVTEAARLAEDPAAAAGLSLAVRIDADAGAVRGDHPRLAQCLDHLLRNAIEWTPAGGRVAIEARIVAEDSEIVIADTGAGMTEEQRALIFDRIAQGLAGHNQPDPGRQVDDGAPPPRRGVGLPLTRQLIEAHGGTLTLDSQPGRGTRAVIRLPRSGTAE